LQEFEEIFQDLQVVEEIEIGGKRRRREVTDFFTRIIIFAAFAEDLQRFTRIFRRNGHFFKFSKIFSFCGNVAEKTHATSPEHWNWTNTRRARPLFI